MATIDETILCLLGSTTYTDQDNRKVYLEFASTFDADAFVRLVVNERHQRILLEISEIRRQSKAHAKLSVLPKAVAVPIPSTEYDRRLVGGYLPDDPTDTSPDPL